MFRRNILKTIKISLMGLAIGGGITFATLLNTSCAPSIPSKSLSLTIDKNSITTKDVPNVIFNGTVASNNFKTTPNSLMLNNTTDFQDFDQTDATHFTVKLKNNITAGVYNLSVKDHVANVISNVVEIKVEYVPANFVDAKVGDDWSNHYLLLPVNKGWRRDALSDGGLNQINLITFYQQNTFFKFISDNRSSNKTDDFAIFNNGAKQTICEAASNSYSGESYYMNEIKQLPKVTYLGNEYYQFSFANVIDWNIDNKDFTSDNIQGNNFYETFLKFVLVSEISYS